MTSRRLSHYKESRASALSHVLEFESSGIEDSYTIGPVSLRGSFEGGRMTSTLHETSSRYRFLGITLGIYITILENPFFNLGTSGGLSYLRPQKEWQQDQGLNLPVRAGHLAIEIGFKSPDRRF